MAVDKKRPFIKKIIKKGHGGHHGGSWKVAYADFVTAMMAFFLVMWLLAISSEQGKQALADYFENVTIMDNTLRGGLPSSFEASKASPGILTGGCYDLKNLGRELEEKEKALIERENALNAGRDDRTDSAAVRPTDRPQPPDVTDLPEGQVGGEGSNLTGVAPGEGVAPAQPPVTAGQGEAGSEAEARAAKAAFATDLKRAVESALNGQTEGQFSVEVVPGGLRIQLMDKEGRPMFVSGQPRLTPEALLILKTVADRLLTIPNKIALEGHTDAEATISQELTNWELSTARASAARRFLGRQGVADDRLTMVAGFSSTQPLPLTNPTDPVNRRIAIMIWDQPPRPGSPPPGSPPGSPEARPATNGQPLNQGRQPQPSVSSPASPPSRESLERTLLEQTLRRAATPDASTAGPPPNPAPTAPAP
ncbi:MAG: OmpA family protein [Deltaproteobacteria bacterium]|jgi:chemotaxis protein MotB|nr:OmpA family protein [Deltaproteobacteria bacterium]